MKAHKLVEKIKNFIIALCITFISNMNNINTFASHCLVFEEKY